VALVVLEEEGERDGEQSGHAEEAHGAALSRARPSGLCAWRMAMVLCSPWGFGFARRRDGGFESAESPRRRSITGAGW
jgi:hypothetical protein